MESKERVKETIDYIENHLDRQLGLDEIAKEAGYSKFHLNRVFLEQVGCTIYKYIQMRRLTVAAEKLVHTEKPVVEIAQEANYSSQQSFTHAFGRLYGHSPQAYRARKVHVPKCTPFRLENGFVPLEKSIGKCEVIAA